jgi:hypothetical protein
VCGAQAGGGELALEGGEVEIVNGTRHCRGEAATGWRGRKGRGWNGHPESFQKMLRAR